jgi:hypothetical protein
VSLKKNLHFTVSHTGRVCIGVHHDNSATMSLNPKPSYHLCPTFTIPPPPNGHVDLGSILTSLDRDGVDNPVNIYCRVAVPKEHIYPRRGPDEKNGFTRTLKELRSTDTGLWAKVFAVGGAGFKFLRARSDDETLTVDKLLTRYFSPTKDYMAESLEASHVESYLLDTGKKEPVYMVTGYMYVKGAKLSRAENKNSQTGAEASATEPNTQTSIGGNAGYTRGNESSSGFDGSTPFILGLRVRKIWWDKDAARKTSDKVAGTVLGDSRQEKPDMMENARFEDDAKVGNDTIDIDEDCLGVGSSIWIFPSDFGGE